MKNVFKTKVNGNKFKNIYKDMTVNKKSIIRYEIACHNGYLFSNHCRATLLLTIYAI